MTARDARASWRRPWQHAYGGGAADAIWASRMSGVAPASTSHERASSDAEAAWARWHAPEADAHFLAHEWPWYAVLERARVETLAATDLPGMRANLAHVEHIAPAGPAHSALYRAARMTWCGDGSLARTTPVDTALRGDLASLAACLDDAAAFALACRPLVRRLASGAMPDDAPGISGSAPESAADTRGLESAGDEGATDAASSSPDVASGAGVADVEHAYDGYRIFDRRMDEEGVATRWLQSDDAVRLRGLTGVQQSLLTQLARRLRRRLLAQQAPRWRFDLDEGRLDPRRLARLVTDAHPRVCRDETTDGAQSMCVSLLVDHSGSMRGERRLVAAAAVDALIQTLESCRVPCELLGYTTRFGSDTPMVRAWRAAGSPDRPGRLNAVRHIVGKSARQPWRQARASLGLLLRPTFGRENVDGEALHWAASRLVAQPGSRHVLVVLSDGTPFDAATAAVCGRHYLEAHLRQVIARIEQGPLVLAALGASEAVTRFYRHSVTATRHEAVAPALFALVDRLLLADGAVSR